MAKNVTRMPNRSPAVVSKSYIGGRTTAYPAPRGGGFTTIKISPDKPANANVSSAAREAAIRAKYPANPGRTFNSGRAAYGPKPASTASRIAAGAKQATGAVLRGAGRIVGGPAGALVGMTKPVGEGSDKPSGPLMSGSRERGKGPSSGLNSPARTAPSRSSSSKSDRPSSGPTSAPSRTEPSRSSGGSKSSGPSRGPTSAPSRTAPSKSSGPSRGPTSAPNRSEPSKGNLGTSRFAKGGVAKSSNFSKAAVKRAKSLGKGKPR